MPKRTAQEKIAKYEAKIRKLMLKKDKRSSRVILSDDEDINEEPMETSTYFGDELPEGLEESCYETEEIQVAPEVGVEDEKNEALAPTLSQPTPSGEKVDLAPELLLALGETTSDVPDFGPSIHDSLAGLWQPILKKGLTDDNRDSLLKCYPIPENCKLLLAPKLNAEISSAVPNVARGRDKKLHSLQQQLGLGITAINKGMDTLLKSENKLEALKSLSDSSRILSDLHFSLTKYRTKLITPSLDKNFLHILQETQRDEWLFGSELGEKIKASKAIERQGQQIKKVVPVSKPAAVQSTAVRPIYVPSGNWSAPPPHYHYPSTTRGGRGGARRPPAAANRKQQTNSAYKTTQSKGRGQPHQ